MKHKKVVYSILLLIIINIFPLKAQHVISSACGEGSGVGGTTSYTIGQIFYCTHSGAGGSLSEGMHQYYKITPINSIENANIIDISVSTYPNPADDFLMLIVNEQKAKYDLSRLTYHIYDVNGQLLQTNFVKGNKTKIFIKGYEPAIYFLKIIYGNKQLKAFKILKK